MAVNHLTVAADQTRDFETKFADTAAHAIHRRVVLARVAGVKDQLVDGPHLDFRRYFSWHHNAPVSGPATIPALLTIRVGSMNPKSTVLAAIRANTASACSIWNSAIVRSCGKSSSLMAASATGLVPLL